MSNIYGSALFQALDVSYMDINNYVGNIINTQLINAEKIYVGTHVLIEKDFIVGIKDPINNTDAVNKEYVDNYIIKAEGPNGVLQFKNNNNKLDYNLNILWTTRIYNSEIIKLLQVNTLISNILNSKDIILNNVVNLKIPENLVNSYNYHLPANVGLSGQLLTTNGNGDLYFSNGSDPIGNNGSIQLNNNGIFGYNNLLNYDLVSETLETNIINSLESNIITSNNNLINLYSSNSNYITIMPNSANLVPYTLTLPLSLKNNSILIANNLNNNIQLQFINSGIQVLSGTGILYNKNNEFMINSNFVYNNGLLCNYPMYQNATQVPYINQSGIYFTTRTNELINPAMSIKYPYLYAGNNNNLKIFNIIDNNSFNLIGTTTLPSTISYTGRNIISIQNSYNYLFILYMESSNLTSLSTLYILNSKNNSEPYIISSLNINNTNVTNLYLFGNYTFICSTSKIIIIDNSIINNLTIIGNIINCPNPYAINIYNNYAYIVCNNNIFSFIVTDITNINNPINIKYLSLGPLINLQIRGKYAFVVGLYFGIINIYDPENIFLVTKLQISGVYLLTKIIISGNYCYITSEIGTIYIIDITNINDPIIINSFPLSLSVNANIDISGRFLFIFDNKNISQYNIYGNILSSCNFNSIILDNLSITSDTNVYNNFYSSLLNVNNSSCNNLILTSSTINLGIFSETTTYTSVGTIIISSTTINAGSISSFKIYNSKIDDNSIVLLNVSKYVPFSGGYPVVCISNVSKGINNVNINNNPGYFTFNVFNIGNTAITGSINLSYQIF